MNDRAKQEDRLARYLAKGMEPAELDAFEQELLESPDLAAELYALQGVDVALRSQRSPRVGRRVAPRRSRASLLLRWAAPLAAVLALAMFAPKWLDPDTRVEAPVFRGEPVVLTLEPFGPVDTPPTQFRWSSLDGAVEYRFELHDLEETVVWTHTTQDTTVRLPEASWRDAIAEGGMWRVVPLDPNGVELPASSPGWFTVLGP